MAFNDLMQFWDELGISGDVIIINLCRNYSSLNHIRAYITFFYIFYVTLYGREKVNESDFNIHIHYHQQFKA